MRVACGKWGLGLSIGAFKFDMYLGDLYLRVPNVGELAWNSTGFYWEPVRTDDSGPRGTLDGHGGGTLTT
ncbi:hypothetical protein HPA02_03020 [Bisbaumannia pacifica]|uniref:Uncharacterized protein n=1 Tax=Bisbaumannia pacifica TaxID=77098 RepID=A0A510X3P8_9GAMM|nr:hypothetical protein HPA02_03020 [Halomonas pacifica]